MPLADLQAALAPAGQWLALDPPEPRATVGGVVAANASGPRRLRYGTVRDLIIGITVVLADGTVAHAGGKVVKNVAGYDLAKLFCGSLGTLGMVVEAIFRLHPLPAATAVVTVQVESPTEAGRAVQRLRRSALEPSAAELVVGELGWPGRLTVVFEGIQPGVEAQAAAAVELLGQVGAGGRGRAGATEAALNQLGALPFEKAEFALKADLPAGRAGRRPRRPGGRAAPLRRRRSAPTPPPACSGWPAACARATCRPTARRSRRSSGRSPRPGSGWPPAGAAWSWSRRPPSSSGPSTSGARPATPSG